MDCLAASFDAVTIERGPVVGRELQLHDLSETFGDGKQFVKKNAHKNIYLFSLIFLPARASMLPDIC